MVIDFWNEDTLTQKFIDMYNLTGPQICNMIKRITFDGENDFVTVFCEECDMKLDQINVTNELIFNGKIVSTSIDNLNSLKELGLVPLDILLEQDSPIRRHLNKYDLQINPSKRELIYKDTKFFIPLYNKEQGYFEECKKCAINHSKCPYNNYYEKDMHCPYLSIIKPLVVKLYVDKAEIEMFLASNNEEMLNYSTVSEYPEIFCTIKTFIQKFFDVDLPISSDWILEKQETFIISVSIPYESMSYKTGYINASNLRDAEDLYLEYKQYCFNRYYSVDEIPKCFWDNIWIIRNLLYRIANYPNGIECGTIYAGIKHEMNIPYNMLKIDFVNNNNNI